MRALEHGRSVLRAFAWSLVLAACGGGGSTPDPVDGPIRLLSVSAATPVLPGTRLFVMSQGLETSGDAVLRLSRDGKASELLPDTTASSLAFVFTQDALLDLGEGTATLSAVLIEGDRASDAIDVSLTLASSVAPVLTTPPSGTVHRNDDVVLSGAGFVSADEGTTSAKFEGTFTPDGGEAVAVSATLPVLLVEPQDRSRGLLRLTTAIGGVKPGVFDGTVSIRTTFTLASPQSTAPVATTLRFDGPEILDISPNAASLEQVVSVVGNGFIGDANTPDETTLLELAGTFTAEDGLTLDLPPTDIVMTFVSGGTVTTVIESTTVGGRLVSSLFGSPRGRFEGTAKPIVIKGDTEVSGDAVPVTLTLGPVVQVVWLKFLPGFYVSLDRYGLTAAAGVLEDMVVARIESIYGAYPVDVRLTKPADWSANGYATMEIGGPDPNGMGLFGYDNTPGKDVGNLRLFDTIGGVNATTQADGTPGYGGVFIESLLFFSSHPGVKRPNGDGPASDELFDEVFDGVRAKPATRTEVEGMGDPTRVAAVARALHAFTSMVGETSSHELGHSLGLANPYGPATAYHNVGDGDGCLMDGGYARPVGERFAEDGFTATQFCYDEPLYLDDIFGVSSAP